jgi:hypothetical protein
MQEWQQCTRLGGLFALHAMLTAERTSHAMECNVMKADPWLLSSAKAQRTSRTHYMRACRDDDRQLRSGPQGPKLYS